MKLLYRTRDYAFIISAMGKLFVTVFADAEPKTVSVRLWTRMRAIGLNNNSGKSGQFSGFDLSLCRDTAPVVVYKISVPWYVFSTQPTLYRDRAWLQRTLYHDGKNCAPDSVPLHRGRLPLLAPGQLYGSPGGEYRDCYRMLRRV